jgi:hypothetical protein
LEGGGIKPCHKEVGCGIVLSHVGQGGAGGEFGERSNEPGGFIRGPEFLDHNSVELLSFLLIFFFYIVVCVRNF